MVAVAFSALVVVALFSIAFHWVMRIRLMRRDSAGDKLAWLSRGSSEVYDTYEALFPASWLPRFSRFAFWAMLVVAAIVLGVVLLKSH